MSGSDLDHLFVNALWVTVGQGVLLAIEAPLLKVAARRHLASGNDRRAHRVGTMLVGAGLTTLACFLGTWWTPLWALSALLFVVSLLQIVASLPPRHPFSLLLLIASALMGVRALVFPPVLERDDLLDLPRLLQSYSLHGAALLMVLLGLFNLVRPRTAAVDPPPPPSSVAPR